jgi:hypothetical protein
MQLKGQRKKNINYCQKNYTVRTIEAKEQNSFTLNMWKKIIANEKVYTQWNYSKMKKFCALVHDKK